jgi:hypothetical protein
MLALILLGQTAFAQATYNLDQIASSSEVFSEFSQSAAPQFEQLQGALSLASSALGDFERGVLLAGDLCPAAQREKMESGRRTLNRAYFAAQSHINLLYEDSERFFQQAIGRALESLGEQSATVCEQPEGISTLMVGLRGRRGCPGRDITGQIVAQLAEDEMLTRSIQGIMGVPWPSASIEPETLRAIELTGTDGFVRMSTLARLIGDEIDQLEARLDLELDPSLSTEQLTALRSAHEGRLSDLGSQLINAASAAWSGDNLPLAICINPTDLGGCSGDDRTELGVVALQRHGFSIE